MRSGARRRPAVRDLPRRLPRAPRRQHAVARSAVASSSRHSSGPSDMIGVMYPLESTASVRMTRNHSARDARAAAVSRARSTTTTPKNQFEEKLRALSGRDRREDPQPGVAVGDQGADRAHGRRSRKGARRSILVSEGYTSIAAAADAQRRRAPCPGPATRTHGNPHGRRQRSERRSRAVARRPGHGLRSARRLRHREPEQRRRSTPSIRAACPASSSTSTRASACRADQQVPELDDGHAARRWPMNTDGRAIVNRNDLAVGMKQITRDSSAYYLHRLQLVAGADRREVPRDQGARQAARRAGPRAQRLLGARRRRTRPRALAPPEARSAEAGGSGARRRNRAPRRARASSAPGSAPRAATTARRA